MPNVEEVNALPNFVQVVFGGDVVINAEIVETKPKWKASTTQDYYHLWSQEIEEWYGNI